MFYKILVGIGGLIALGLIISGVIKVIVSVRGVGIEKSDVCPFTKEIKKRKIERKMFCPKLGQIIKIKSGRCTENCGFT